VRGASPWEILVFALALVLVPPVAFFSLELLAGLVSKRAATLVHLALVGFLVAVLALQVVRRAGGPTALELAVAAAIGVAGALAYRRSAGVRSFATVLAAAPVLFLLLFLFQSPASKLVLTEDAAAHVDVVHSRTPVVLIVFDEFPTGSLLNARHEIDAVRFPSFADLAAHSTWYRNATTVHEGTTNAVPAILTGILPKAHQLPDFDDHPDNLFTLLGGTYRLDAFEEDTRLCPPGLCEGEEHESFGGQLGSLVDDASVVYGHVLLPNGLAGDLPSVSESWQDFLSRGQDEAARFADFLRTVTPATTPTLYTIHALLPHSPWQYMPSGERYAVDYPTAPWAPSEFWTKDPGLVVQSWQRHLLQVGYTDTLLGQMLARLRRTGLYDRSLIVVVADHGISFRPGHKRRPVWPGNLQDIAYVPLFVKLPEQQAGRVSDEHAETVDVVPTIAAVLGVKAPWNLDGRSLLGPVGSRPVGVYKGSGERVAAPLSGLNRKRWQTLARQLALFGSGEPASTLFGVGRYRALLGRPVGPVPDGGAVKLDHGRSPLEVSGTVSGFGDVAVAVGGRIVAVDQVYGGRFWALLPKPAVSFSVLGISGDPKAPSLVRLG
jgi:hypothetical protein